ncbi:MAG: hypothetical protein AB1758_32125 [Candidatus Eremiobacterota bacterium]
MTDVQSQTTAFEEMLDAFQRGRALAVQAREVHRRGGPLAASGRALRWAERALEELTQAFELLKRAVREDEIGRETAELMTRYISDYQATAQELTELLPAAPEPVSGASAAALVAESYADDRQGDPEQVLRRLQG